MNSNMLKQTNIKTEVNRSWWYRLLRSISMFCFRFWWAIWLFFILYLVLWLIFCCCSKPYACDLDNKIDDQIAEINRNIDSCCACTEKSISDIDRLRDSLGGHVGPITITLKWESVDDLDLSLVEPNGNIINYQRKDSPSGGHLDIDMNAGGNASYNPIENIYYGAEPPPGNYRVIVKLFSKKSGLKRIPFRVYVKYHEEVKVIDQIVSRNGESINIIDFTY